MEQGPKRRKHKDNPYTLNFENKSISFIDGTKKLRIVMLNDVIFDSMNKFELEDKSELNRIARYREYSELYDESLYNRALNKPMSVEDEIIRKSDSEDVHRAIKQLPTIQQRRIKKYWFDKKNVYKIAEEENATHQAISKSLNEALKKLKEILEK